MLGALSALTLTSGFSLAMRAQLIRRLKREELYTALSPTWEQFCQDYLPISRATADNVVRQLEILGEDFLAAAEQLGLGQRQLRALAAAPQELLPRAEGDEIVVGDERVPLGDKDRVVELLEELVTQQERLTDRIVQGEEQLAEQEEESRRLKAELKAIEDARSGRLTSEFDQACVKVLRFLREAADYLAHPDPERRPSPEAVLRYVQAMDVARSELIQYGGQYVVPDWARSSEALREHMEEYLLAARYKELGDQGKPPWLDEEGDKTLGEWGDEESLL